MNIRSIGRISFFLSMLVIATPLFGEERGSQPLNRVPADAGLFIHLKAGDLWKQPLVNEIRKGFGKASDDLLKKLTEFAGLNPDSLDSLTFHYPKLPEGPADEQLFCIQIVTKTPQMAEKLMLGLRPPGEKASGDTQKLNASFLLHRFSDTHFAVTHQSLLKALKDKVTTTGPQADALKLAREGKHHLVLSIDPSGIPNEIISNPPPEVQPFIPLLKSQVVTLTADVDTETKLQINFVQAKEDATIEVERALKLAIQLGENSLDDAIKADPKAKELNYLFTELQKTMKNAVVRRAGKTVTGTASMKMDKAQFELIAKQFAAIGDASERAISSNNLKQIGLAMHNYMSGKNVFPAASICDRKGKPLLSWRVTILPYIEQEALYKEFKLDEPWDSEHNKKLIPKMPNIYLLPGSKDKREDGKTQYRVFVGSDSAFDYVQGSSIRGFTDGTSNTLLAVEAKESVIWSKPEEIEWKPEKPIQPLLYFREDKVCMVLFADGSVRAISRSVPDDTWKKLIQKADGKVIDFNSID